MPRVVVTLLRIAVVIAVLVGIYAAVIVIPTTAADDVAQYPPYAPYRVPFVTAAVLAIAGLIGALVAGWMLLSMISRDLIFTARAIRWVDVAIGCVGFASAVAAAVTVDLFVSDVPSPGDGMELIGTIMMAGFCTVLGATFTLLLVLLRHLLRKAADQRSELAGVI